MEICAEMCAILMIKSEKKRNNRKNKTIRSRKHEYPWGEGKQQGLELGNIESRH